MHTELNNHARMLLKVLNVGTNHGEKNIERVKSRHEQDLGLVLGLGVVMTLGLALGVVMTLV